jgi:hypothetical protein
MLIWRWTAPQAEGAVIQAALSLVDKGDPRALVKLANTWKQAGQHHTDDDVLEATFGNGITAYRDQVSGKVILRIPGKGEYEWRQAVRHGDVTISQRRPTTRVRSNAIQRASFDG